MRPDWCLPSRVDNNLLSWVVEVNGLPADARTMPKEVQEKAYRLGSIHTFCSRADSVL